MAAPLQQPPLEDMMRNLKVDPSADMASLKDVSPSDGVSSISFGDASSSVKGNDESLLANDQSDPYPTSGYYGYSYPGFHGGYYVSGDGSELQYPVMQADDGSLMYMSEAGYQPGYYSPYVMCTVGVDGQYFNQHVCPSPQPSIISPGYLPYTETFSSPYLWDPSCLVGYGSYGNPNRKSSLSSSLGQPRATLPNSFKSPDFSSPSLNKKKSMSPLDVSSCHGMLGQLKSANKMLYRSSPVNLKANGRSWVVAEKPKTRKGGDSDFGSLNDKNHDSSTVNSIDPSVSCGDTPSVDADVIGNSNIIGSPVRRDQYNSPDFPTKYDQALFFIIKSYSEDDVHKSIKYNVWASTPNGNNRLDNAFRNAQQKITDKSCKCPVFLFFSVNASGQFCGVAEMIGRVDFNKSMDFWQQDKWDGYFPVKWHIIKDVPNPQLRHIILENNENKPVTNSRDTQEVKFQQGIEMLDIFKNYSSTTSVLDDFDFYENREKAMQEKRIRPVLHHFVNAQAKANILPMTCPVVKKRSDELAGVNEKNKDA